MRNPRSSPGWRDSQKTASGKPGAVHMVKKSVMVTEQQESWIRAQVQSGAYDNDSAYLQELIQRNQAHQHSYFEALRAALVQGEASGEPRPLDAVEFKRNMKNKYCRGGC